MKTAKELKYFGLTDKGMVREKNEDAWSAHPDIGLFIVSDGMGGEFSGDIASKIVVETLPKMIEGILGKDINPASPEFSKRLGSEIGILSNAVRMKTRNEPGLSGMGATVALAVIGKKHAVIAHMGDSRIYLLRKRKLIRLTKDHSIIQLLLDNNEISPEEAETHPARGQITRFVAMEGNPLPEIKTVDVRPGDIMLLCSDGLTQMLRDSEIQEILEGKTNPEEACTELVARANENGGKDNITAIVIKA
ncbi:MAG: Stp1/IreP family PP2C-type Ser/Thr phosphatase [Victivallales bacterium]